MQLKEFLSVRKGVRRVRLFAESSKVNDNEPNQLLAEEIQGDPLFSYAMYKFEEGHLKVIAIAGKTTASAVESKRQDFLTNVIKKWDRPSKLTTVQLDEGRGISRASKAPALIWSFPDLLISAAFTPAGDDGNPIEGSIQIKIEYGEDSTLENLFPVLHLSQPSRRNTRTCSGRN